MQIFYLSNRPTVLAGTIDAVTRWMPWVTSAVVVAPPKMLFTSSDRLPVTVIDEAELSGHSSAELKAMDHVTRNVTLRRAALPHLDDSFILSDDDYRPLTHVGLDNFVDDRGRHKRYWFYKLEDWPDRRTDYDKAQIRTLSALRLLGSPTRAYGAHMPQIMNRAMLTEVFKQSDEVGAGALIDEWSLYFNLAPLNHPLAFADPEPFQTLAWPEWPHQWPHQVAPHPIRFENHYPAHEAPGGLFHSLPAVTEPDGPLARIEAWRTAELAIGELRFDPAWNDPWTQGKPVKRGIFSALRLVSKVGKYIGLGR